MCFELEARTYCWTHKWSWLLSKGSPERESCRCWRWASMHWVLLAVRLFACTSAVPTTVGGRQHLRFSGWRLRPGRRKLPLELGFLTSKPMLFLLLQPVICRPSGGGEGHGQRDCPWEKKQVFPPVLKDLGLPHKHPTHNCSPSRPTQNQGTIFPPLLLFVRFSL